MNYLKYPIASITAGLVYSVIHQAVDPALFLSLNMPESAFEALVICLCGFIATVVYSLMDDSGQKSQDELAKIKADLQRAETIHKKELEKIEAERDTCKN